MEKRKRGRPRLPELTEEQKIKICKKEGCIEPAAHGQVYCKIEHSPYGLYGKDDPEFRRYFKMSQKRRKRTFYNKND